MKRLATAALLLLALILVIHFAHQGSAPEAAPAPSVAVQTVKLSQTTTPREVDSYGSVIGGPAEMEIVLPAPGSIAAMLVTPGQNVRAGQVLARIAPDAASAADLRKAEDALSAAQAARAHTAALLATHLATAADLAAADQAQRDAQAGLSALRQSGAGVERSVTAPFAGIITAVLAAPGAAQAAGASLFRLADPAHLAVRVGVAEDQAAGIAPGAPASVTLLNGGGIIPATVVARAAMLNPQTGLVDVTLALSAPAVLGEPVAAGIKGAPLTGFAVPRDAVQTDENGTYVFQLGADGLAHRATVQVLGQAGAQSILAPNLNPAQPLITTGAYQLDDGAAVRAVGPN